MDTAAERPPRNDAERLLRLVRGMTATDLVGAFRHGLSAQELMSVITALPTRRLNELTDRARLLELPVEQQRQHRQCQQLAVVVDARIRAGISQAELARRIGVASAAVNQWESAGTQPTGLHLARLLRELPDRKELLDELHDQQSPAVQASG
jgi:DNA-binding transcriptional regulator YiaG